MQLNNAVLWTILSICIVQEIKVYAFPLADTTEINRYLMSTNKITDEDSSLYRIQLQKMLEKSIKINYIKGIAETSRKLGNHYQKVYQLDMASFYYLKALDAYRKLQNRSMEAKMANNLGTLAEKMGAYTEAITRYLIAYEIFDSLDNKNGIAATANNLGILYYLLDKPQKALGFFSVSVTNSKQSQDTASMIYGFQHMGNISFALLKYDSARYYYETCVSYSLARNDFVSAGQAFNSLGIMYMMKNEILYSKMLFQKAILFSRQGGDLQNQSSAYDNLGLISLKLNDLNTAIVYFDSSIQISRKAGLKEQMKDALLHLADAYNDGRLYEKAYEALQSYVRIEEELETQRSGVSDIEALFVKQKQENQILLLEKEQERRKIAVFALIGIILLLIAGGLSGFYVNRIKQKAIIDRKLAEMESIRFQSVIETQEEERKRIATDLHDSVGQILSLSKLHLSEIHESTAQYSQDQKSSFKRSLQLIDEACQEIRDISHNLMPGSLIRLGLLAAVKDLSRNINLSNKLKIILESNIEDQRFTEKVEISLFRIIQEVFNNIIKHSKATVVEVSLHMMQDRSLIILIKDNGIGFDTALIRQNSGLGWKSIYSRLAMIEGQLHVNSEINRGTHIEIQVFL